MLAAVIACTLMCCFAICLAFVFYKRRDRRHKKSKTESKLFEDKSKNKMNAHPRMVSVQSRSTDKDKKVGMAELGGGSIGHIEHASSVDITEHNSENENENDNEHSSRSSDEDLYTAGPNEKDGVATPKTPQSPVTPVSSRKTPKSTRGVISKGENGNNMAGAGEQEGGIEEIDAQLSGNSDDNVLMNLAVEMAVEESGRHGTEGRVSVDQDTIGNTNQ